MEPATDFDLARLLAPMETRQFFVEYWERKPLTVSRDSPDHYRGLLSFKDLDFILSVFENTRQITVPPVSIVIEGTRTNATLDCLGRDGTVDVNRVYQKYCEGATVLIEGVDRFSQPLMTLCRNLSASFSGRAQVNMYLTPTNSQGFSAHWDSHDVIVLQLSGTKLWRIYDSLIPLPMPTTRVPDVVRHFPPRYEVQLKTGDLLYLPRGFVHEARTSDDHSLHLTIGLLTVKWLDLVNAALAAVADEDERFRQSLPADLSEQATSGNLGDEQIRSLLEVVLQRASLQKALDTLRERGALESAPYRPSAFAEMDAAEGG